MLCSCGCGSVGARCKKLMLPFISCHTLQELAELMSTPLEFSPQKQTRLAHTYDLHTSCAYAHARWGWLCVTKAPLGMTSSMLSCPPKFPDFSKKALVFVLFCFRVFRPTTPEVDGRAGFKKKKTHTRPPVHTAQGCRVLPLDVVIPVPRPPHASRLHPHPTVLMFRGIRLLSV